MAWTPPMYSRSVVDRAGKTYVDPDARAEAHELALAAINNWRSAHAFPLNTLQMNLRDVAHKIDSDPTIAQRTKRLPSIRHKLERIPGMKLSRMQDIGGCRAVLSSVDSVTAAVDYYKTQSRIKHKLVREDFYTWEPPPSGYRGVHLVYRYYSDRNPVFNGLQIEMQLRTQLQHSWATAVETVGTFTQQALKSSWGEAEWLRFFALMSTWLAMREGTPIVPGTPGKRAELARELKGYAKKLRAIERLNAYGAVLQFAEERAERGQLFLLELEMAEDADNTLLVRQYDDPLVAADAYGAVERAVADDPSKDVVLVRVESLELLRRAYPNYFLDTTAFVASIEEAIS